MINQPPIKQQTQHDQKIKNKTTKKRHQQKAQHKTREEKKTKKEYKDAGGGGRVEVERGGREHRGRGRDKI